MNHFTVKTTSHTQFLNIDQQVQRAVDAGKLESGIVHLFVPHTTAGITINENADPDVTADMELILERAFPWSGGYAHAEGNAAAHVKASLMGFDQSVFVENGRLQLGTWQSIYFCEFDGPRTRQVLVWTQRL